MLSLASCLQGNNRFHVDSHANVLVMCFLPDDHSRVILTQIDGVPSSDYVNASYIDVSCQLSAVG